MNKGWGSCVLASGFDMDDPSVKGVRAVMIRILMIGRGVADGSGYLMRKSYGVSCRIS